MIIVNIIIIIIIIIVSLGPCRVTLCAVIDIVGNQNGLLPRRCPCGDKGDGLLVTGSGGSKLEQSFQRGTVAVRAGTMGGKEKKRKMCVETNETGCQGQLRNGKQKSVLLFELKELFRQQFDIIGIMIIFMITCIVGR